MKPTIILLIILLTGGLAMAETHKHIRDYNLETKSGRGHWVINQDYDAKNPPTQKEGFYSNCKVCGE